MHWLVVVLLPTIRQAVERCTPELRREEEPLLKSLGFSKPCTTEGSGSMLLLLCSALALISHACWGLSGWLQESFPMMLKLWG